MVEGIEHIIRQTWEEVDYEPRPHVVHAYDLWVRDHLPPWPHECGVEVEDDVDEEDDVDDAVEDQQRDVLRGLVLEGHVVGDHDGCVEGEAQDHPVPDGFEGAVVEQDVGRGFRGFLAVLREDVRVHTDHLQENTQINNAAVFICIV